MKYIKYSAMAGLAVLLVSGMTSCHNADNEFPDYEGGISAYFANQYPVKTITLGEDSEQDNTLDNQYMCRIFATQGGLTNRATLKSML